MAKFAAVKTKGVPRGVRREKPERQGAAEIIPCELDAGNSAVRILSRRAAGREEAPALSFHRRQKRNA